MNDLLNDKNSEQYRHECEIRYIASLKLKERREYLALVAQHRGVKAVQTIKNELTILWKNKKSATQ